MVLNARATRRLLIATALVGSGALIAGCGGSSNGGSSGHGGTGNGGSKTAISLRRAADISSDAAGYRLNMVMAESVAGQSINLSANGSYTPKSHQASMTLDIALPESVGGEQRFKMVMSKDTFYMKFPAALANQLPGGKPWFSISLDQLGKAAHVPGVGSLLSSSSSLNDPGEYLDFLRAAAAGSVTDIGQEQVDGVQTTHYQAQLQFSKLADAMPSTYKQMFSALGQKASVPDFPVDVWIDGSDLVRQIMMNVKATVAGHTVGVQVTENFSHYGIQPAPAIPSAVQTSNLLALMKSSG